MPSLRNTPSTRVSAFLQIVGWTLAFLVMADLAVNNLFKRPTDPLQQAGTLAQYFEYGRSLEGKLKHILADEDNHATAVAKAGWLDKNCQRVIYATPNKRTISIFGMSFSNHVGEALTKLDDTWHIELFAGPGAPPNHSYKCVDMQNAISEGGNTDASDVQVLGILASSLKGMLSHTGANTGFESPSPFTYPRYTLDGTGKLVETAPPISSTDAWREALRSPAKLQVLKSHLAQHDEFYDPLLFDANLADSSATLRMLRRAYAQHQSREIADATSKSTSQIVNQQMAPVLRTMIVEFALKSRSAGKRPIILLIHDKGSDKILFDVLKDTLSAHSIEFISTHDVAPSTDPSNFVSDGHFTAAANLRIASKLHKLLCGKSSCQPITGLPG